MFEINKKIRLTLPATTSNLGPGFDFLGIALNKYNIFEFEVSDCYDTIGFDNVRNNMVLDCYKKIINKYSEIDIPVKITMIKNEVPVARGLGSSATAIVAGCVAANYYLGNKLSEEELINEMVSIEGHPDNIMPCFKGGAVTSIQDEKLLYFKSNISNELIFNVLIPKYKVSTEMARGVLPKQYSLSDLTFNASRASLLLKALSDGDIDLIKVVTKDKVHEPYRKKFIKEWDIIEKAVNNYPAKLNISGSGPTMLLITKDNTIINKIEKLDINIEIYPLSVSNNGCILEEI